MEPDDPKIGDGRYGPSGLEVWIGNRWWTRDELEKPLTIPPNPLDATTVRSWIKQGDWTESKIHRTVQALLDAFGEIRRLDAELAAQARAFARVPSVAICVGANRWETTCPLHGWKQLHGKTGPETDPCPDCQRPATTPPILGRTVDAMILDDIVTEQKPVSKNLAAEVRAWAERMARHAAMTGEGVALTPTSATEAAEIHGFKFEVRDPCPCGRTQAHVVGPTCYHADLVFPPAPASLGRCSCGKLEAHGATPACEPYVKAAFAKASPPAHTEPCR